MAFDRRTPNHRGSTATAAPRPAAGPGKRTLTAGLTPAASARRTPATTASPTPGQPMPAPVQDKMERALGADFSAVRIHEGPEPRAKGALAYTQGTDIHFAPGQYQPASPHGQELLGHELTHVVQQAQGRVRAGGQARRAAIHRDDALEREADELGARAAHGEPAGRDAGPASTGAGATATASAAPAPAACETCGGAKPTAAARAQPAGASAAGACATCGSPAAPVQAKGDETAPDDEHDIDPPAGHDERMARLDEIDQALAGQRAVEAGIQAQLDALARSIPANADDQQARDSEAERLGTELDSTQSNEIDLLDEEIAVLDTSIAGIEGLSLDGGSSASIDHWRRERDRLQAQRKQADKDKWHVPLQRQRARDQIRDLERQLASAPLSDAGRDSLEAQKRGLGEKLADTAQHRKPAGTFLRMADGRCCVVYQHSVRVNGSLNWRFKNPGSLGRSPSSTQDPPGALAHVPGGDPCGGVVGLFIFSDPELGRAETRRQVDVAAAQGRFVGEFLLSYSHEGQPYLNLVGTQCPGVNVGTEAGQGKDGDRLSQANKEAVKRGMFFAESGSAAAGDEWTCSDSAAPTDIRALLGCDE